MSDPENPAGVVPKKTGKGSKAEIDEMQSEMAAFKKEFNAQINSLLDNISKKLENQKNYSESKILELKSDVKTLNKRVVQLPLDGDISKLIKERDINEETLMEITLGQTNGDDTLNNTYQERTAVQALITKPSLVTKTKAKAPGELKFTIFKLLGPEGNDNFINAREDHLSAYENSLLDELPFIPDRTKFLEEMKNGSGNGNGSNNGVNDKWIFERSQRWDSDFVRDTPVWHEENSFEDFFANFWRVAEENYVSCPKKFKATLYKKIYETKGKYLGDLIKPEKNMVVSALKYYLMIRRLVSPYSDAETSQRLFFSLKQKDNQTVDEFFHQKLRAFKAMQPHNIPVRQWNSFYENVAKSLKYRDLAIDMAHYAENMKHPEDYSSYLNYLLKRAQHYISWADSGHSSSDNVNSCYTQAMKKVFLEDIKDKENLTINMVTPTNDTSPSGEKISTGEVEGIPEWVHSEEGFTWDQVDSVMGALNIKSKNVICWHCNIRGHVVSECFSRKNGKPPAPGSRFAKTKNNMSQNSPNNRVITDQFKKGINQIDPMELNSKASMSKESPTNREEREQRHFQALMREVDDNLRNNTDLVPL